MVRIEFRMDRFLFDSLQYVSEDCDNESFSETINCYIYYGVAYLEHYDEYKKVETWHDDKQYKLYQKKLDKDYVRVEFDMDPDLYEQFEHILENEDEADNYGYKNLSNMIDIYIMYGCEYLLYYDEYKKVETWLKNDK